MKAEKLKQEKQEKLKKAEKQVADEKKTKLDEAEIDPNVREIYM